MCNNKCKYDWLNQKTSVFQVMKNMTRCVDAEEDFDTGLVTICPLHHQIHMCRGGQTCNILEDGTCSYTNKSFEGLATTQALTGEGLSDLSANALGNFHQGIKRKAEPVGKDEYTKANAQHTKYMDLDVFISSVHRGLAYDKDNELTSVDEPLSYYMKTLLEQIYAIMSYNDKIVTVDPITPCQAWVESTVQVLRAVQGKDLIPKITSIPTIKAIVLHALSSMETSEQMWWAKRPCIRRQWKM